MMASAPLASRKLVQEVGNWVSGERFWGREAELAHLCSLLREGASVRLTAPRRIGKTSLMREAGERLKSEFAVLHVDLQRAKRAADLVVELGVQSRPHRDLWSRTREVFRNALGTVDELAHDELTIKLSDALTGGWQRRGERLLEEFASAQPTIPFIDELPILVNRLLKGPDYCVTPERAAEVDAFLSWLRAAVVQHRGKLRFVVAGSIGLEPILRQARLSATLNVFTPFELEPWDEATARGALNALANNYQLRWHEGGPERVVERLGCCVPHHVQMFWGLLRFDAMKRGVFHIGVDDVERVFQRRLRGAHGQAELSHYEERLRSVLGGELLPLPLDLLSEAALAEGGLVDTAARELCREHDRSIDQMREILDVLQHDGYLREDEAGGLGFISRLVHDWWASRYKTSYVPVAARAELEVGT